MSASPNSGELPKETLRVREGQGVKTKVPTETTAGQGCALERLEAGRALGFGAQVGVSSWLREVLGGKQANVRLETHLGPLDSHSWRPWLSLKRQKDKPALEIPHSSFSPVPAPPPGPPPPPPPPCSAADLHSPLQALRPQAHLRIHALTHTELQPRPSHSHTPVCPSVLGVLELLVDQAGPKRHR